MEICSLFCVGYIWECLSWSGRWRSFRRIEPPPSSFFPNLSSKSWVARDSWVASFSCWVLILHFYLFLWKNMVHLDFCLQLPSWQRSEISCDYISDALRIHCSLRPCMYLDHVLRPCAPTYSQNITTYVLLMIYLFGWSVTPHMTSCGMTFRSMIYIIVPDTVWIYNKIRVYNIHPDAYHKSGCINYWSGCIL